MSEKTKVKPNAALIERMEDFGLTVTVTPGKKESDSTVTDIKGSFGAALRFIEARDDLAKLSKANTDGTNTIAKQLHEAGEDGDRLKFKGGSFKQLRDDLAGHVDMKPFIEARAKMRSGPLYRKLQEKLTDSAPRRRRTMSEHDGDWDYGRRWEIAPFAATTKAFQPARTVKIRANFDANCSAKAEALDRYGAMVWALNDLIEQAGIRTEVIWAMDTRDIFSDGRGNGSTEITIKRPKEYVAPSMIAAVAKARFFRRFGFSMIVAQAEVAGKTVDPFLGQSRTNATIEFQKGGTLIISPDCINATNAEIERELLKTING